MLCPTNVRMRLHMTYNQTGCSVFFLKFSGSYYKIKKKRPKTFRINMLHENR